MSEWYDKCVVIDLTPLLPAGANGGLGLLALNLARDFAKLLPECRFVWLTADDTHELLSSQATPNVERACVLSRSPSYNNAIPLKTLTKRKIREGLKTLFPAQYIAKLKALYRTYQRPNSTLAPAENKLLLQFNPDLLFCPFTAPFYANAKVPTVSIVVDLQYLHYPQFFSTDDYYYRDKHFKEACQLADHIVCISDFVRDTVLQQSGLSPTRVSTIHIGLSHHVKATSAEQINHCLAQHELESNQYFLYPANFWEHKNHQILLTAWGMWNAQHPQSTIKLVMTGTPNERQTALRSATQQMGLESKVVWPGYLHDEQYSALLQGCRAVLFPSLYEGFGMPVIEAMAYDKPVLCSNLTSLPEIGGDAVLSFDPRKPDGIVKALTQLENDLALPALLVKRGRQQVLRFGDSESMSKRYLALFQEVIETKSTTKL